MALNGTDKLKSYLTENWGAPFIVSCILLLLGAAAFLSCGLSSLADTLAIYAYYALIIGVMLQLASFLKCRKSNGENI